VRCAECDSRLAHDQRYCVECGARRGPLPAGIAPLIGAIHEQGRAAALPADDPLAGSLAEIGARPSRLEVAMPGPRAAAVAVMGMLAFGVIVGSLVGGESVATLAGAPLIVVGATHPASRTQPAVQNQTVTDTIGGGGAAPATSTAAAAPQAPAQAAASPSTSPTPTTGTSTTPNANGLPPVRHVFLIVLSDRGFTRSFGTSSGYLGGALRRQGELVQNYYAVAAAPLANEIALISGQGPTPQTASDCPTFSRITPARKSPRGQVLGSGCAYPSSTKTLATQLTSAHDTWKAYLAGVSKSARTACRVPKLGAQQPQMPGPHTTYLSWRDPFLFFRGLTAGGACRTNEVGVGQLAKDLKGAQSTPSLAYIIPAPCADGSETPCRSGGTPSLAAANRFLKSVVPEIKRSPAYHDGGLIAITFDQAPQTGPDADPSACCNNPTSYPNLRRMPPGSPAVPPGAMGAPAPATTTSTTVTTTSPTTTDTTSTTDTTTTTPTTPLSLGSGETTPTGGGGQVGLLLISPYVKKNSSDVVDYFNHFSLLASFEELFGLHRLGYAAAPAVPVFGAAVFNNYVG
jgi:phosphatidylinositol-3-phosphatase